MRSLVHFAGAGLLALAASGAMAEDRTELASVSAVVDGMEMALQYEAYFGGMHIASGRTEFIWSEDAYRASAQARSRGLLDWYGGWVGEAHSEGGIQEDGLPAPALHRNSGLWRGDTRSNELTYEDDGTIALEQTSPPDPNKLTPIPEESIPGTFDPITAILTLSRALWDAEFCSGEMPVYDGRRRYDLSLEPVGTRALEPSDYNIYSGEALECRIAVERIGGFRIEQSRYSETAGDRLIYVASPIAEAPPIPVRLEVETDYGDLIIHLTAVRYDGAELALQPGVDNLAD